MPPKTDAVPQPMPLSLTEKAVKTESGKKAASEPAMKVTEIMKKAVVIEGEVIVDPLVRCASWSCRFHVVSHALTSFLMRSHCCSFCRHASCAYSRKVSGSWP